MPELLRVALMIAVLAPLGAALITGVRTLLGNDWLPELRVQTIVRNALVLSFLGSLAVAIMHLTLSGGVASGDISFGNWVEIGSYEIPLVLHLDHVAVTFSLLGAALTGLVARFSVTYLHKEAGFNRFFVLLGVFGTGTQLVAFAGALDLFFAGWEAIGIASALFIGFFHERSEPVRSSVRAFVTYRLCDLGFLIAIVTVHEHLASTRLSDIADIARLPQAEITIIGLLLLLAAFGKSAQLPFSGWLVRAMEGPTPTSALFYGAVSIHTGLFMLLRTSPVLEASPIAAGVGVTVGLLTALYGSASARTHADAKGALAQATLAQTGLILAEICMGWTTFALVHLTSHALLRVWQYLRAPNTIHDAHHHGHHASAHAGDRPPTRRQRVAYLLPLHRFRVDDRLDAIAAGVMRLSTWARTGDERMLHAVGAGEDSR